MTRRIVILGAPRTGKTTLSLELEHQHGVAAFHTDDLIGTCDWSEASELVSRRFDRPGPWLIEGVAVVRALRKWLERHPTGTPCDEVVALWAPRVRLTLKQQAMADGTWTIWLDVVGPLRARGVAIR